MGLKIPIHTVMRSLLRDEPMVLEAAKKVPSPKPGEPDIEMGPTHWTLGMVIGEALNGTYPKVKDGAIVRGPDGKPEEELLTSKERADRFALSLKMFHTKAPDEPEVSVEEMVLIKRLVNLRFDTMLGGQAIYYLEQVGT